mmetsp:Transcript_89130/g.252565  ORF Transcript_89130/g.252565 Transcript_89130/m.252565 type:complete len:281 (+) Transcript_89130:216-1058(+)
MGGGAATSRCDWLAPFTWERTVCTVGAAPRHLVVAWRPQPGRPSLAEVLTHPPAVCGRAGTWGKARSEHNRGGRMIEFPLVGSALGTGATGHEEGEQRQHVQTVPGAGPPGRIEHLVVGRGGGLRRSTAGSAAGSSLCGGCVRPVVVVDLRCCCCKGGMRAGTSHALRSARPLLVLLAGREKRSAPEGAAAQGVDAGTQLLVVSAEDIVRRGVRVVLAHVKDLRTAEALCLRARPAHGAADRGRARRPVSDTLRLRVHAHPRGPRAQLGHHRHEAAGAPR